MDGKVIYTDNVSAPSSRVQIYRLVTQKMIFEVNDCLSFDPKMSKLQLCLLNYQRDGAAFSAQSDVRHWVDANEFKAVCRALMAGRLESLAGIRPEQVRDGKPYDLWVDQKGTPQEDGSLQARILTIRMAPGNNLPYQIMIANGTGRTIGEGAVAMVKAERDLMVAMSRLDMYTLASEVLDYVRDWELMNFKSRQLARTVTLAPTALRGQFEQQRQHQQQQQRTNDVRRAA